MAATIEAAQENDSRGVACRQRLRILMVAACRPWSIASLCAIVSTSDAINAQPAAAPPQAVVVSVSAQALAVSPRSEVSSRVDLEINDSKFVPDADEIVRAVLFAPATAVLLSRRPPSAVAVALGSGSLSSIGRFGSGPGEFRQISDLSKAADSLILLDPAQSRISLYHSGTRKFLWSRQLDLARFNSVAGVLADGAFVLHSSGLFVDRTRVPVKRSTAEVAILPRIGKARVVLKIPDLVLKEVVIGMHGRSEAVQVPERLGSISHVIAVGQEIIATSSERPSFSVYDSNGRLKRTVNFERPLRTVTRRMKELAIQSELDLFRSSGEPIPNRAEYERVVIRGAPYNDSLPAIHSVHRSSSGVIWLVEGIGPGDAGWSAVGFRASGELVGRLQSRVAGTPLAIDDRLVLTRELHESGVAVIRVRAVMPASAPSGSSLSTR